jgi:hypothetical protein
MPEYHGAGQALRIDTVEAVDVLAWHAAAWDRLALAAPERLPMLSYAWVKSFLEHRLDPGESWRCLFAYTGDELVVDSDPAVVVEDEDLQAHALPRHRPRGGPPGSG